MARGLFFESGLYNNAPLENFIKSKFDNLKIESKIKKLCIESKLRKDMMETNLSKKID